MRIDRLSWSFGGRFGGGWFGAGGCRIDIGSGNPTPASSKPLKVILGLGPGWPGWMGL